MKYELLKTNTIKRYAIILALTLGGSFSLSYAASSMGPSMVALTPATKNSVDLIQRETEAIKEFVSVLYQGLMKLNETQRRGTLSPFISKTRALINKFYNDFTVRVAASQTNNDDKLKKAHITLQEIAHMLNKEVGYIFTELQKKVASKDAMGCAVTLRNIINEPATATKVERLNTKLSDLIESIKDIKPDTAAILRDLQDKLISTYNYLTSSGSANGMKVVMWFQRRL